MRPKSRLLPTGGTIDADLADTTKLWSRHCVIIKLLPSEQDNGTKHMWHIPLNELNDEWWWNPAPSYTSTPKRHIDRGEQMTRELCISNEKVVSNIENMLTTRIEYSMLV